jgi:flagellar hook-associated protein 2
MTVSGASSTSTATTPSTTSNTTNPLTDPTNTATGSGSGATGASTNPSNIDWNALIQSQVAAMLAPADTIDTKITNNQAKVSAYQNLQTLLSTLASGADPLASQDTGSATSTSSIFSARRADITANGNVTPSSVVSMSLDNGAPMGNYSLSISQLAQAQKIAGTSVASQSNALGYSGTFSVGLAGGTSANINITSNMSLQDVVASINAQSSTTNVQASIIQVSSNQYQLVLTGTEDNANIVTSSVSGDDVMNKLGVTDGSGNFTDQIQKAQPAVFTLDGVQLTRNTNDVSDVISGVTFNLLQPTPSGASLNIDIVPDTDQIETALQTFVTDYNAVRDFVTSQQATNSDGTASSSSVLFGDSTMNDIMTQLQSAMNTSVNGLSLSDLGLSFTNSNDLQLDTSTLESTMSSNLQGVENLLASQSTTTSGDLSVVATGNSAPSSFNLDLQVDGSGNLVSASVGGDSSMFSVVGNTIIGATGTEYAGMAFSFSGSSSETVTVNTTQGVASLISGIASAGSDPTNGSLQDLVSNLQSQDTTMQQQVSDIQSQASIYQTNLTNQYAQYQASIAKASTTLNYLQALLNANSNNG